MKLSAPDILLAAKQHEIAELRQLAESARFAGLIGHMIHVLQRERGASSIYLASAGKRFEATRLQYIAESITVERLLRDSFEARIADQRPGQARQYSLMAWVVLGLDSLPGLREQVARGEIRPDAAVAEFSQIIAGLCALSFEVTDSALGPGISAALVALFNFIQGKEQAGQERAVGALELASGHSDRKHQQRLQHLIEAQERSFQTFSDFAGEQARARWREMQEKPELIRLERLRRILLSTADGGALDSKLINEWFDCCTERLERLWLMQCSLVEELLERCHALIAAAEQELQDSEGLLRGLIQHPPASTGEAVMAGDTMGGKVGHAVIEMLQVQSDRLARVEGELETARRSLNERKIVERAKGLLMARLDITEEAAYRMLRQTAMDQNRRIVEVAEAALALPGFIAPTDERDANRA